MVSRFLAVFVAAFLISCAEQPKGQVEKPFTVVDEEYINNDVSSYLFQDKNGQQWWVRTTSGKYEFGQTIE